MRLTPQPTPDLFDTRWAAERLRDVGVCLTDRQWTPLAPAEDFFVRYAIPALKAQGWAPGVTTAVAEVESEPRRRRPVGLVAFSGALPAAATAASPHVEAPEVAAWAASLPAYTPRALERVAVNLPAFLQARSRMAEALHQVEVLSGQLADSYEELSLVYRIGSNMTVKSPTAGFLKSACEAAADVMELRGLGVLVWDKRLGEKPPMLFGNVGLDGAEVARLDGLLRAGLRSADDEGAIIVNETGASPPLAWLAPKVTQLLAVPMRREGRTLGCMFAVDKNVPPEIFGTFNRGVFTSMDRKLLAGVALHVALFLENRTLFQDSEALMMGVLRSLVAAVDAKDTYTCGHSVRVASFARALAETAGFEPAACERVYLGGLLHDVGKIGVDDAVLRKPGRLTDDEFAQIRRHPEIGYGILRGIPQLQDVLPGVLHHHEKYDGSGYPGRLAGEGIPLLGRLMCIADSFDAMTSSRTYRTAMTPQEAMAEIRRCRGTHFDPKLSELFCHIPIGRIQELVMAERDRQSTDYRLFQTAAA